MSSEESDPPKPKRPQPKARRKPRIPKTEFIDDSKEEDDFFIRHTVLTDEEEEEADLIRKPTSFTSQVIPQPSSIPSSHPKEIVFLDEDSDDDDQALEITNNLSDRETITPPPEDSLSSLSKLKSPGILQSQLLFEQILDESEEEIELEPELANLQTSLTTESTSDSTKRLNQHYKVRLDVKFYINLEKEYKPLSFIVYSTDYFDTVYKAISSNQQVPITSIIITYKNVHLFRRATPNSLNMKSREMLEAFPKELYKKLHSSKEKTPDACENSQSQSSEETMIKLKLRNRFNEDTRVRVRTTMSFGDLAKLYKEMKKLSGERVKFQFEDEDLPENSPIESSELEDEDVLFVIY